MPGEINVHRFTMLDRLTDFLINKFMFFFNGVVTFTFVKCNINVILDAAGVVSLVITNSISTLFMIIGMISGYLVKRGLDKYFNKKATNK